MCEKYNNVVITNFVKKIIILLSFVIDYYHYHLLLLLINIINYFVKNKKLIHCNDAKRFDMAFEQFAHSLITCVNYFIFLYFLLY